MKNQPHGLATLNKNRSSEQLNTDKKKGLKMGSQFKKFPFHFNHKKRNKRTESWQCQQLIIFQYQSAEGQADRFSFWGHIYETIQCLFQQTYDSVHFRWGSAQQFSSTNDFFFFLTNVLVRFMEILSTITTLRFEFDPRRSSLLIFATTC